MGRRNLDAESADSWKVRRRRKGKPETRGRVMINLRNQMTVYHRLKCKSLREFEENFLSYLWFEGMWSRKENWE